MTGAPVIFAVRPVSLSCSSTVVLMSPMTTLRGLLLHDLAVERDDDHRQLAVVGEELAFDDIVRLERGDHRVVGGTVLGHLVGHQRRRVTRSIRLAARRQHGDEARDAVDELQLGRQSGEGLELLALEQVVTFDDDEHVVLARGKALVDRLVAAEFLGVGAEQLGEEIVDLQLGQADEAEDSGDRDEDRRRARALSAQRAQASPARTRTRSCGAARQRYPWLPRRRFYWAFA